MSYETHYYASYPVDGGLIATILSMMGVIIFVSMILAILMIVSLWRVFKKAGEEGWKAIIPFYNQYTLYKIVWDTKYFFVTLALIVVLWLSLWLTSLTSIFMILYLACLLALVVIQIKATHKLSKSFGHGGGFTVGLIFLSVVFIPMLGFGTSQYQGKPD